jgi:hypothetical protein
MRRSVISLLVFKLCVGHCVDGDIWNLDLIRAQGQEMPIDCHGRPVTVGSRVGMSDDKVLDLLLRTPPPPKDEGKRKVAKITKESKRR